MAKFVIKCPKCGRYAQARTGFFARKKIDCACGNVIDVRTDRLSSRTCSHYGNDVVFDQSTGTAAKCPGCGQPINTVADQDKTVEFTCAQCGVRHRAYRGAAAYTCPVCDHVNDIAEQVKKAQIRREGLASVIKYEGDNETLVWKHPIEDFNMGSQTAAQMKLIGAQAEAEAYRMKAAAEAEEMRMKGYIYQQETARKVGLEAMQNGIGSTSGGSALGDLAGLGITLGAMGSVVNMTKDAMSPVVHDALRMEQTVAGSPDAWDCACGNKGITMKFCPECGKRRP